MHQQHRAQERNELVKFKPTLDSLIPGIGHHPGDGDAAEKIGDRDGKGPRLYTLDEIFQAAVDALLGPFDGLRLQTIGFDDPAPIEHFGQRTRKVSGFLHALVRRLAHALSKLPCSPANDRKDRYGQKRKAPVLVDHDAGEHDQCKRFAADPGDAAGDRFAKHGCIVEKIGNELT